MKSRVKVCFIKGKAKAEVWLFVAWKPPLPKSVVSTMISIGSKAVATGWKFNRKKLGLKFGLRLNFDSVTCLGGTATILPVLTESMGGWVC